MIIVNTEGIAGKNLEHLGLVFASAVQTKNALKDIMAGLQNLMGGDVGPYAKLLDEATSIAVARLTVKAQEMGADAVVNVRFFSPSVMDGAAEIVASGTAVKFV